MNTAICIEGLLNNGYEKAQGEEKVHCIHVHRDRRVTEARNMYYVSVPAKT